MMEVRKHTQSFNTDHCLISLYLMQENAVKLFRSIDFHSKV